MSDARASPPLHGAPDGFKALGDPVRRRIVELLAEGEKSVEVLVRATGVPYGSVSQHLQVLLSSGIVTRRAEGRRRMYRLRSEAICDLGNWLDDVRRQWSATLDGLESFLDNRS